MPVIDLTDPLVWRHIVYRHPPGDIADDGIKLTCYRIAQVQLNNIIKHARAKHARIELSKLRDRFTLTIKDDGIGFDPAKNTGGIGLRNIRNRVGFYNGTVRVESATGKGCTLTITIPLIPGE